MKLLDHLVDLILQDRRSRDPEILSKLRILMQARQCGNRHYIEVNLIV